MKNKGNKRNKIEDRNKTDVKSTKNEKTSVDFMKLWGNLPTFMDPSAKDTKERNTRLQKELNSRWVEFYSDVTKIVSEAMNGERLAKVQKMADMILSYGNRMMAVMNTYSSGGSGSVKSFQEAWNMQMPNIGKEFVKTLNGDSVKPYEMYTTWLSTSMKDLQDMLQFRGKTSPDAMALYNLWNEFNSDISDIIRDIGKFDTNIYDQLGSQWVKYTSQVSDEISKFIGMQGSGLPNIQGMWSGYNDIFGKLFQANGLNTKSTQDLGNIFNLYSDTANRLFKTLNIPMPALMTGLGGQSDQQSKTC
jgi:polyhydroxyalkanoate synthesis regulator protein